MKGTVKENKCTEFLFACGYLRKKKITFFATTGVAVGGDYALVMGQAQSRVSASCALWCG